MKRFSKSFLGLTFLALLVVIAGCGGGKDPAPIEKGPFDDYMGLQVEATLTYSGKVDYDEGVPVNSTVTVTYKVLEETGGIFKTAYEVDGAADGSFIEKAADGKYYDRGFWEIGNELPGEQQGVILTNPITTGFESSWWGKAIGTETVTVPAGTFKAWVFCYEYTTSSSVDKDYTYFVPYLGIIKTVNSDTENGQPYDSSTYTLTSYSFGTSASGYISPNLISQTTGASSPTKLRKIFRHK